MTLPTVNPVRMLLDLLDKNAEELISAYNSLRGFEQLRVLVDLREELSTLRTETKWVELPLKLASELLHGEVTIDDTVAALVASISKQVLPTEETKRAKRRGRPPRASRGATTVEAKTPVPSRAGRQISAIPASQAPAPPRPRRRIGEPAREPPLPTGRRGRTRQRTRS